MRLHKSEIPTYLYGTFENKSYEQLQTAPIIHSLIIKQIDWDNPEEVSKAIKGMMCGNFWMFVGELYVAPAAAFHFGMVVGIFPHFPIDKTDTAKLTATEQADTSGRRMLPVRRKVRYENIVNCITRVEHPYASGSFALSIKERSDIFKSDIPWVNVRFNATTEMLEIFQSQFVIPVTEPEE